MAGRESVGYPEAWVSRRVGGQACFEASSPTRGDTRFRTSVVLRQANPRVCHYVPLRTVKHGQSRILVTRPDHRSGAL
jgi:hypothetical protein